MFALTALNVSNVPVPSNGTRTAPQTENGCDDDNDDDGVDGDNDDDDNDDGGDDEDE